MKQKILFIINPISGDIKKANIPAAIDRYLDQQKFEPEIVYTERAGHAMHLAMQAVADNFDIVVAVGGDGSINEVAQALIYTDVKLGIIPMGSGNGLATHLKLPLRNAKKALAVINEGRTLRVDTGSSNIGAFVSCAGEGLDAAVARTYRHQSIRGFLSYFLAVIKELLFLYKARTILFETDGVKHEMNVLLFSVFNSKYYGYEVSIYPKASLNDGYFNLVAIPKTAWWKLPYVIFMGLIGKIDKVKIVQVIKAKRIVVHDERKRVVQVDGDSLMTSSKFSMQVEALSLQVIVPSKLKII